ncbi:hypothetical protein GCM10010302_42620 [Streptomyces polychromogenes]|uniref:Zinc ribbon domain-containing protein n=1 Tax=Streptomyces polychromogenes TaxID=67342 RepID=A0ABP3F5K6_9ACTN
MTSQTRATGTRSDGGECCAECGTRAEPGQSFCEFCGAVLGWADRAAAPGQDGRPGTRAADAASPPGTPAPRAAATPARPASAAGPQPASRTGDSRAGAASSRAGAGAAAASQPASRPGAVSTGADSAGSAAGQPGPRPGETPPGTTPAGGGADGGAGPVGPGGARPGPHGTSREGDGARALPGPGSGAQRDSGGANSAVPAAGSGAGSAPQGGGRESGRTGPDATGPDPTGPDPTGPQSAGPDPAEPGPSAADAPAGPPSTLTAAAVPAPEDATARARSLLVPVADPGPRQAAETPSVAPVLPGRPVADRPQVRTPGREPGTEGGTPCPWCATSNRPDRHFCVLCAMPLADGPAAPGRRRPWWRRVLDFRNREAPWAGDRPRLRRGFGYLVTWVLWACVLALLITAVVYADTAVSAVRDHFAKRTPVAPDTVAASRSYEGHEPRLLFDKLNNTWWGPGISQAGTGEWVEARFEKPTRLLDVIITPGVSSRADKLAQSALPHRVEAVITTADGKTATRILTLDQGAGGQRRAFRLGEVTAVRFVLRSAYGAAADKQVSIAEIEFFGPSKSGWVS